MKKIKAEMILVKMKKTEAEKTQIEAEIKLIDQTKPLLPTLKLELK